jgi:hypothetical protein
MDLAWHPGRISSRAEDGTVTLIEVFAAVLLVGGSALVLWTVREADAAFEPIREPEATPVVRSVVETPLRRAA